MSGNQVPDKVAKVGFSVTPSPNVDAPIINEYPLTLECKVVSWEGGILIGEGTHERFIIDKERFISKTYAQELPTY